MKLRLMENWKLYPQKNFNWLNAMIFVISKRFQTGRKLSSQGSAEALRFSRQRADLVNKDLNKFGINLNLIYNLIYGMAREHSSKKN